jgi:hypothetical protein
MLAVLFDMKKEIKAMCKQHSDLDQQIASSQLEYQEYKTLIEKEFPDAH